MVVVVVVVVVGVGGATTVGAIVGVGWCSTWSAGITIA